METGPVTYFGKALRKTWRLFLHSSARGLLSAAKAGISSRAGRLPSPDFPLRARPAWTASPIFPQQALNPEKGV